MSDGFTTEQIRSAYQSLVSKHDTIINKPYYGNYLVVLTREMKLDIRVIDIMWSKWWYRIFYWAIPSFIKNRIFHKCKMELINEVV